MNSKQNRGDGVTDQAKGDQGQAAEARAAPPASGRSGKSPDRVGALQEQAGAERGARGKSPDGDGGLQGQGGRRG